MIIRTLKATDRQAWQPLWEGYLMFYQVDLADDVTDITYARFLDEHEPIFCLVAEDAQRQLVGLVHYQFHRSTWSKGHSCYLEDLFVATDARASGVGRQLIASVHDKATEAGCSCVYWQTQAHNTQAQRLYNQVAQLTDYIQYKQPIVSK